MTVHVMLDLETLGRRAGCVILSIGAVSFRIDGKSRLASQFHANIDRESCQRAGLVIDPETELWWAAPERAEARRQLDIDPRPLIEVIEDFHEWFKAVKGEFIWAHGSVFDIPIWEYAANILYLGVPWDFRNVRDTRTLFHLSCFDLKAIPRKGTYHNSLDDASHQALCVQRAWEELHS